MWQLPLVKKIRRVVAVNLEVLQHANGAIEKVYLHADGRV